MTSCHKPEGVAGEPKSTTNSVLETGASIVQDFAPISSVCAYLNAYHVYASDPSRRAVSAHHYCSHITEDLRQCILFDSPNPGARLIGVEYMITPRLYTTLDSEERKLWHSHVFEVKSGQLIMPQPASSMLPKAAWEAAETKEMEQVVQLYGKVWHLWQVDRGDELPLGRPELMVSFTKGTPGFAELVRERDEQMGVDHRHKAEIRKHIPEPEIHPDADSWDQSKLR